MNKPVIDSEDRALVNALARSASLPVLPDEVEAAAADLPRIRAAVARLYAVPMDREEDLPVVFRA